MKLPSSEEMKAIDTCAIENYGIPGVVLMENAGVGTVRLIQKYYSPPAGSFALIFIGPGNNGGDCLVIGRHLHQQGCEPIFFFLVNPDDLTGDAAINLTIVKNHNGMGQAMIDEDFTFRDAGMPGDTVCQAFQHILDGLRAIKIRCQEIHNQRMGFHGLNLRGDITLSKMTPLKEFPGGVDML